MARGEQLDTAAPAAGQARRQRAGSRDRLLDAAAGLFLQRGYSEVSVEDIAGAAGVSRMTFYRNFTDKADLSLALYKQGEARAKPRFARIGTADFRDYAAIRDWIGELFEADRASRGLLKVFGQAMAEDANFTAQAQELIPELIATLGGSIPAFRVRPDRGAERRRWLEAWLLLFEILDQSNHAALDSGVATDPLVMDILAGRFLAFVQSGEPGPGSAQRRGISSPANRGVSRG